MKEHQVTGSGERGRLSHGAAERATRGEGDPVQRAQVRVRSRGASGHEVRASTGDQPGNGGAAGNGEVPGQHGPEEPSSEGVSGRPPGGRPPESGNPGDTAGEPGDPYRKPEFSFYQQEFDGTEVVSEADRSYVLDRFERIVDVLRDSALRAKTLEAEEIGPDLTIESAWAQGEDNRAVSINVHKNGRGDVVRRELVIYWDVDRLGESENIGKTTYEISYGREVLQVTRDDDSGVVPPGSSSLPQGHKERREAEGTATELGFNNGPVGRLEIDGLQRYMDIPQ